MKIKILLIQRFRNTGKINALSFGLRIRRPQVRILPGVPSKSKGYGSYRNPFFVTFGRMITGQQAEVIAGILPPQCGISHLLGKIMCSTGVPKN
jgi:hypothetical protein